MSGASLDILYLASILLHRRSWIDKRRRLGFLLSDDDGEENTKGKYTKVTLDLSEYQSAEMQIRFHCYDTDNMGLSYYWQIDNLEILGSSSNNITGYNVYRNGIKIATSTTTDYVDPAPLDGTNTYAVSATGSFGESSPSNSVELQFTSTGISTPTTQSP